MREGKRRQAAAELQQQTGPEPLGRIAQESLPLNSPRAPIVQNDKPAC